MRPEGHSWGFATNYPSTRDPGPGAGGARTRGPGGGQGRQTGGPGTGNRGTVGPGTGGRAGPGGPGAGAGDQGTGRPVGMHTPPAPALRVDTDGAGGQSRGGGLTTSSMVAVGLLDKAREMKKWLIEEEGIPARSQPKLEPSKTGYAWLHRWRHFYNISKRYHWNRLKVSWKKIKARCYVHLTNIFRLAIAHPVTEIRGVPSRMEPPGFRWSGRSLT